MSYLWLRRFCGLGTGFPVDPIEVAAMRLPRVQFTIRWLMVVVAVGALILTPVVWVLRVPAERRSSLIAIPMGLVMLSIAWSPIIAEGVRTFRRFNFRNPRTPRTPPEF